MRELTTVERAQIGRVVAMRFNGQSYLSSWRGETRTFWARTDFRALVRDGFPSAMQVREMELFVPERGEELPLGFVQLTCFVSG